MTVAFALLLVYSLLLASVHPLFRLWWSLALVVFWKGLFRNILQGA